MILIFLNCPGTNNIALICFTRYKGIKNVLGDRYVVLGGVVLPQCLIFYQFSWGVNVITCLLFNYRVFTVSFRVLFLLSGLKPNALDLPYLVTLVDTIFFLTSLPVSRVRLVKQLFYTYFSLSLSPNLASMHR